LQTDQAQQSKSPEYHTLIQNMGVWTSCEQQINSSYFRKRMECYKSRYEWSHGL